MTAGAVLENPGSLAPAEDTRESPSWKGFVCLSCELLCGQEKYSSIWVRPNWSPIPVFPCISCFTLGKSLNLSDCLDCPCNDTYAKSHWKDCKPDVQCWDTCGDSSQGVSPELPSFLPPYTLGTAVWTAGSEFLFGKRYFHSGSMHTKQREPDSKGSFCPRHLTQSQSAALKNI